MSKEKLRRKFLKEEEVRRDPGGKKGDREEKQYDSRMKAERKHSHGFNLLLFIRNVSSCQFWMPCTYVRTYELLILPG